MDATKTSRKVEGPKARALREIATAHRGGAKKTASIDMKGSVQAAIAFAKDMFPQAKDIRLEEVEASSGGWYCSHFFCNGRTWDLGSGHGRGSTATIQNNKH